MEDGALSLQDGVPGRGGAAEAGGATGADGACSICMQAEAPPAVLDGCKHRVMCYLCAVRWGDTRATCPLCRAPFTTITSEDRAMIHIVEPRAESDAEEEETGSETGSEVEIPGSLLAAFRRDRQRETLGYSTDEGFVVGDDVVEWSSAASGSESGNLQRSAHSTGSVAPPAAAEGAAERRARALAEFGARRSQQLQRRGVDAGGAGAGDEGSFRNVAVERFGRMLRRQEEAQRRHVLVSSSSEGETGSPQAAPRQERTSARRGRKP